MTPSKKQNTNRMEGSYLNLSPPVTAALVFIVLIALWAAYCFYMGKASVPLPSYTMGFRSGPRGSDPRTEGFYGGIAVGAGEPNCLRTSSEAAELVALFDGRAAEGAPCDNLRELKTLVGKLACFKKDLLSPSHIIEATRYQKFSTVHDIEPVAETTGRCFSKTLSPRDLELSLDKWAYRGGVLIKRLAASYRLESCDIDAAEKLFLKLVRDVADVARSQCLADTSVATPPGVRDPVGLQPDRVTEMSEYTGYY